MKKLSSIIDEKLLSMSETESSIEAILFNALMRSGKFVLCRETDLPAGEGMFMFPQMKVGHYRADFIIRACGYKKHHRVWPPRQTATICVECDGKEHHTTPEQIQYDKERDEYFLSQGIKTLRFTGGEIYKDPKFAIEQITHELDMIMQGGAQ